MHMHMHVHVHVHVHMHAHIAHAHAHLHLVRLLDAERGDILGYILGLHLRFTS